ncbi:RNA polymerase II holoenzyme cyclin-like subunit [Tulasnella sp. 419]|nr:RNA polymerase II holoenzyme cyclin-like subunit [Tulasnella sp. 418]KAG8964231.1 RNA polymerase II holoenzyme cyclin-like subunit [Tulasnella sp. 419]
MATNFWESSHYTNWLFDEATIRQARADDLQYASQEELALIGIYFANLISKLGKRLTLRQQVIATATVYFRRFYLKSSYCETDPFFVAATCCYVAAKTEETPVHLKTVVQEARSVFSNYGIKTFPTDNSKLAEMEFYLLEDLEFHLVVFHPYRSLAALCGRLGVLDTVAEAGEVGAEPDEERFWGTGEGKLNLDDGCVQMAWFVINDSFRGDLCLQYPPYLIAIASLYMAVLLHGNTRAKLSETFEDTSNSQAQQHRHRTRSTTAAASSNTNATNIVTAHHVPIRDQILDFLAGLNVSLELIAKIVQQILSVYALWDTLSDGSEQDATRRANREVPGLKTGLTPHGNRRKVIHEKDLVTLILSMKERRDQDLLHPPEGKPLDNNRLMERF